MQTKKIKLGDVYEMPTKKGRCFLQCVEIPHTDDVELIKVFYKIYDDIPEEITKITEGDYFFIRFPLSASLKMKIVKFVGNVELPKDLVLPLYYRTLNPFGEGWQIVNSQTLNRETVLILNEEQKQLSPWGGMNDTLIKQLLDKGWRLKNWSSENFYD